MNSLTQPNHIPLITLEAQTDLDYLITQAAAVAATHRDWQRLRQLFLATFAAERMTVEYPELVAEWSLNR